MGFRSDDYITLDAFSSDNSARLCRTEKEARTVAYDGSRPDVGFLWTLKVKARLINLKTIIHFALRLEIVVNSDVRAS